MRASGQRALVERAVEVRARGRRAFRVGTVLPGREYCHRRHSGEDDERRAETTLQKQTDEAIAEIDALLKGKEAEILEV